MPFGGEAIVINMALRSDHHPVGWNSPEFCKGNTNLTSAGCGELMRGSDLPRWSFFCPQRSRVWRTETLQYGAVRNRRPG